MSAEVAVVLRSFRVGRCECTWTLRQRQRYATAFAHSAADAVAAALRFGAEGLSRGRWAWSGHG